ncbi:polysaccharide deacetylase family protein [Bacillus salitolerans]|uniref:Polysaccharide deacetylase family protein n=1 Tax=Bacillus salitolerans TaxID=1437434 RepID=A0ABW4LKI3_9BACI
MKKFFLLCITIFLLVACSKESTDYVDETNEQPNVEKQGSDEGNNDIEDKPNDQDDQTNVETNDEEPSSVEEVVNTPQYRINDSTWEIEHIVPADEKLLLLTIDDAPDKYGLEMATSLKDLGVNAIFFVNGHFIDTDEEKAVLKKIYDLGFPIGNHTWNHKNLKELSEEDQYNEIIKLSDEIEAITGERPKFFRAPFGANTDYAKDIVKNDGMILMNWSYGYDFDKNYMTKESIADIMVNTPLLKKGANLLMHDREWTYLALPDIVQGLRDKGYVMADPKLIETIPASK